MTLTETHCIRFTELARREPRLWGLYLEASALREKAAADPDIDAERAWYDRAGHPAIKPRLLKLVGWFREDGDPELSTTEAYDAAYAFLLAAMPPF
jgi:hypothetical protein